MRRAQIEMGGVYEVRVSGTLVPVRIRSEHWKSGWDGVNVLTGREIRIRTAGRLRRAMTDEEVDAAVWRHRGRA